MRWRACLVRRPDSVPVAGQSVIGVSVDVSGQPGFPCAGPGIAGRHSRRGRRFESQRNPQLRNDLQKSQASCAIGQELWQKSAKPGKLRPILTAKAPILPDSLVGDSGMKYPRFGVAHLRVARFQAFSRHSKPGRGRWTVLWWRPWGVCKDRRRHLRKIAYALAVASALTSTQVGAATIDVLGVSGAWDDVVAQEGNSFVTGEGTSQLKWGQPFTRGGKKSGYGIVGKKATGYDVEEEFLLGTFTHYNNIISAGTSIIQTTLNVSVNMKIDGVAMAVKSAFDFIHFETPNLAKGAVCANNGNYGIGVNSNGCADRVTISSVLDQLQQFKIGDALYTLQITGFRVNGVTVSEFWTKERATNPAFLVAKVTRVEDVTPPPAAVPLPATGWLVLAGLAGLAAAKRRRS